MTDELETFNKFMVGIGGASGNIVTPIARLRALVELAEKATPGPWLSGATAESFIDGAWDGYGQIADVGDAGYVVASSGVDDEANAAFISAARNSVPDMEAVIAERDALHALAKKLGNALMDFTPGGSEYFTKVGEDYYADAEACTRVIRERLAVVPKFARERNAERRRSDTAETALTAMGARYDDAYRGNATHQADKAALERALAAMRGQVEAERERLSKKYGFENDNGG
jgi:hypothetical protein